MGPVPHVSDPTATMQCRGSCCALGLVPWLPAGSVCVTDPRPTSQRAWAVFVNGSFEEEESELTKRVNLGSGPAPHLAFSARAADRVRRAGLSSVNSWHVRC